MAQPETTFRIGRCSASVFLNSTQDDEGQTRTFRSVSLRCRYQDGQEWKTSTSFTLAELPAAGAVLQLALHYVATAEADAEH